MASRKPKKPAGKLLKIGRKEIREYKRGKVYYVRWNCLYESNDGNEFWEWTPTHTVHGKKAAAESEAEKYKQELEKMLGIRPVSTTLADYAKEYQASRKEEAARTDSKLSPLTVERDELDIAKVIDEFGAYTPQQLTAGLIIQHFKQMRKDGASNSAIHKVHAKLSAVMEYAIGELSINDVSISLTNPCTLKVVKNEAKRPKAQKQEALTLDEATSLAQTIKSNELTGFTVAVLLALFTGMRRGEVLGLTWNDVDLSDNVIHVRNQYAKDKKLRAPKSDESRRDIAFDEGTAELLKKWRKQQQKEFREKGARFSENAPVCSNFVCRFIDPDTFGRWRRNYFIKNGLGRYKNEEHYTDAKGIKRIRRTGYEGKSFHALRHTQATLLIADGTDVKTVQGRLGHSDATLTMNTYAHTITEKDREAAQAIGKLLNPKSKGGRS